MSPARRFWLAFVDGFSPLKTRDLRLYLSGQAVSLIGTWMQATAQSWVVWQLSHSPAALGFVAMFGSLPLLVLGPWAGPWADRLDRRRVLVGTQTTAMLLAFALALLVQTGAIRLWHVYLLATMLGVVTALDFPSQQAFIGDLAGIPQVRKAVVMNAMINQLSRMVGPAIAGWVIGSLGVAPAFWLNGASFVAVIATLLAVRGKQVRKESTRNPLGEFVEGLRFIAGQPRIQDLLIFTLFVTFFGFSNMQLLPAFATDVLGKGPEALGFLLGASGAGALTSAMVVVPLIQRVKRTGLMLGGAVAWAAMGFLTFSLSHWLALSMAALYVASLAMPVVMTTSNGLLQTLAPGNMRARLLSTWLMVGFGMQPVAALLVGLDGKVFGPAAAVRINGLLMILGAFLLLASRAELRSWSVKLR